jgi:hypothetical protein
MQDVFPIVFEFKRGEQPTAEKLTGLVKHTDVAFSRMNQAIGDPWDYSYHTVGSSQLFLSPENLAINNVSRLEGPSDYLSPVGGCWNEKTTEAIVVKLAANRNSWSLGFPFVKVNSGQIITQETINSDTVLVPLDWSTDITISDDTGGVLDNQVDEITLVIADGDFFVDSSRGVITAYDCPTAVITLTIKAGTFNMFGAGVPWGTHNVIPTWEETSDLCTVEWVSTDSSEDTWLLTLPMVWCNPRVGNTVQIETPVPQEADLGVGSDASWYQSDGSSELITSGYSSNYRLPQSIASIVTDTTLPEGFCQLWDNTGSRFIPLVEFVTQGTTNTLKLLTPVGWLNDGGPGASSNRYRLVVTGISIAENVNYLNSIVRNGHHVGLMNAPALSYLPPISHDDLTHRYSGSIPDWFSFLYSTTYKLKFTESTLPLNPHSQYLHRYGYYEGDSAGNSSNAMRGNLVFAGADANMTLATGDLCSYSTSGIMFGGGTTTAGSLSANTKISLWGMTSDSWTSGTSAHFPANIPQTGMASSSTYDNNYGALTVLPALGSSLYIRGYADSAPTSSPTYGSTDYMKGASIALDMGQWGEYNNIKVSVPIHSSTTYEAVNMPASTDMGATFGTKLAITPSLANRLSPYQIREFRFRGGAYIPGAANKATGSLGVLSGKKTSGGTGELDAYFTSPGMVGCDFLNVYSNAIFFSDTGDGKRTSFTERGETWLKSASANVPSGMYFIPRDGVSVAPYFAFADYDSTLVTSNISTSFGYSHGFYYNGTGPISLTTISALDSITASNVGGDINVFSITGSLNLYSLSGDVSLGYSNINYGTSTPLANVFLSTASSFTLGTSTGNTYSNNVMICANADISLGNTSDTYADNVIISAGANYTNTASFSDTLLLLGEDIYVKASAGYFSAEASTYVGLTASTFIELNASTSVIINATEDASMNGRNVNITANGSNPSYGSIVLQGDNTAVSVRLAGPSAGGTIILGQADRDDDIKIYGSSLEVQDAITTETFSTWAYEDEISYIVLWDSIDNMLKKVTLKTLKDFFKANW